MFRKCSENAWADDMSAVETRMFMAIEGRVGENYYYG